MPFRLHHGMALSQWFSSSLIMVLRLVSFSDTGLFASQVWTFSWDMVINLFVEICDTICKRTAINMDHISLYVKLY
ncbi:hypothetical protein FB451DRAFT_1312102 [Mycena latifolia]|nr:hypothetical protein FB451DRAFT_1312102 [Mycena latifolia]